jgi:hypothetical protein
MIKQIMKYLERIGTDQITFRKVGSGSFAYLNIQVQDMNNFNRSGYVSVSSFMLNDAIVTDENLDYNILRMLENKYNYGMNDKREFDEEVCPNCGAGAGDYVPALNHDRNKRTCLRCKCTWYGYELTADMVRTYIKEEMEKKDNDV